MGPQSWRARDELQARSEDRAFSYSPTRSKLDGEQPSCRWRLGEIRHVWEACRLESVSVMTVSGIERRRVGQPASAGGNGRVVGGCRRSTDCVSNLYHSVRRPGSQSEREYLNSIQPTGRMGAKRRFAEEQARDAIARQGYSGPVCQRLCRWETGGGGRGEQRILAVGGEGEGQGVGRSWDLIFK